MNLLFYLFAGFLLDVLGTLDILAVQKDQAFKSAAVSFMGTVIDCYIFYDIILSPDFLLGLLFYATGSALGTILTMRRQTIKSYIINFLTGNKRSNELAG